MNKIKHLLGSAVAMTLISVASVSQAQVIVKDAWVRATVAQQKATGAFMKIQSKQDAKLISISTASAEMVEIHEMSMENQMMKMQQVESITLPVGKWVELTPGGFHVMLMGLNAQAKENDEIRLSLTIEGKNKKREVLEVKAKVRALNSGK